MKASSPSLNRSFVARPAGRKSRGLWILSLICLCAWVLLPGCSIKRMAVNKLGDALAAGGTSFSSDDDPDLIRDAAPFSLKTMESLLAESPRHEGLRRAAASGFTQYAYAFVQMAADETEATDYNSSERLRERARRLYVRALAHGLRGLEVRHPGFEASLRRDAESAVKVLTRRDVPIAFWTTVPWAALIALSKDNPALIGELPIATAMIDRLLELDPDWNNGAIHSFLISFEPSRPGGASDAPNRCRARFDKVMTLSQGSLAGPYVALAETVSLAGNNRAEFESLLRKALSVDLARRPESRLENEIMQRRARWQLSRLDELFVPPVTKP